MDRIFPITLNRQLVCSIASQKQYTFMLLLGNETRKQLNIVSRLYYTLQFTKPFHIHDFVSA